MKEINGGGEFLDTACSGVTRHTVGKVLDEVNDKKTTNNLIYYLLEHTYHSELSATRSKASRCSYSTVTYSDLNQQAQKASQLGGWMCLSSHTVSLH